MVQISPSESIDWTPCYETNFCARLKVQYNSTNRITASFIPLGTPRLRKPARQRVGYRSTKGSSECIYLRPSISWPNLDQSWWSWWFGR